MSLSSHKFYHAIVYSSKTERQIQIWARMTTKHLSSVMLHTSTIFHDVMKECVVQIGSMKICQQHWQTLSCAWKAEILLPLHIRHGVFQSIKHVWLTTWMVVRIWIIILLRPHFCSRLPTVCSYKWQCAYWKHDDLHHTMLAPKHGRWSLQSTSQRAQNFPCHSSPQSKGRMGPHEHKVGTGNDFFVFFIHTFFPQKVCSRRLF